MENMGRVNFGPNLERQRKGIDGSVQVNGHNHYYWKEYTLPMEHLEHLDFTIPSVPGTPGFYEFSFEADETGDTFLDFTGWGKGCILVNGFNIGDSGKLGHRNDYIFRVRF